MMVAAEPLWRCCLCAAACHVQCFADSHTQLPTVGAKLRSLLDGGSGSGTPAPDGRQQQVGGAGVKARHSQRSGPVARPIEASSGNSSDGEEELQRQGSISTAGTAATPPAGSSGSALRRRGTAAAAAAGPRRSRSAAILQALAGVVGGGRRNGRAVGEAPEGDSGYSGDSDSESGAVGG